MPRHDPSGPNHDPIGAARLQAIMRYLGMLLGPGRSIGPGARRSGGLGPNRRRRRKGGEDQREPVEPDNPKPLSGGAAAPLDYDD